MKLKREIGLATLANWAGMIGSYLIAFLATPIIVHAFGDTRYGLWSLSMAMIGTYGMLDLGIRTTLIKYYSEYIGKKDEESANTIINTSLYIYLWIICLAFVVVCVIIWQIDRLFNIPHEYLTETRILFAINGVVFGIELLGNTFRAILVSHRKFALINKMLLGFSVVRVISIIAVLKMGMGIIAAGICVLIVDILRNLTAYFYAGKLSPFLKISIQKVDPAFIKGKVGFTFYNLLRQISVTIVRRSDLILVGMFFDMKIVAYYSIGESLVNYAQKIPKGLRVSLLPLSSTLHAMDQKSDLQKMGFFLPKYTMSFFYGILLMGALFGNEFINLWMGPGYDTAFNVMIVLLASQAILMSQSMLIHIVTGMGYNKFFGYLSVTEMVLKITLSILLIKPFGIYGIAFGSLFTFILTNAVMVPVYALKKLDIDKINYYLQVIILPGSVAISLYLLNQAAGISNIYLSPIVAAEYLMIFYLFIFKEVKFRQGRLLWNFSIKNWTYRN